MYFLQFILTGFTISAPIGPMALICIEKTLLKGQKEGLLTGLMIALADLTYTFVAVAGASSLIHFLTDYIRVFKILGGIFLIYLGFTFVLKKSKDLAVKPDLTTKVKDLFGTYLLTLSNPATILMFMSLIFTIQSSTSTANPFLVILGIFLGSILWWIFLVSSVSFSRSRLKPSQINFISQLGGAALIIFGVYSSIF